MSELGDLGAFPVSPERAKIIYDQKQRFLNALARKIDRELAEAMREELYGQGTNKPNGICSVIHAYPRRS